MYWITGYISPSLIYFSIQTLQNTKLLISLCAPLLYALDVVSNYFTKPEEFIFAAISRFSLFLLSCPCSVQNIKTKVFTNFECQTWSNFPSVLVLLQYFLNSKLSSCWLEYISHQFYKHLSCKSLDSREFFFTICLFYSYTGSETSVMGQY